MTVTPLTQPHCLYRFWSHDGELLYVGITATPSQRWKQHAGDKPWWHEVNNVTLERFTGRKAVLEAERAAIVAEQPRYNIVHNRQGEIVIPPPTPTVETNEWVVTSRHGFTRITELFLWWEVSGDPLSDHYYPDEISAQELLRAWRRRYAKPHTSIYWSVRPLLETAPFQTANPWADGRSFLTYFDWPTHAITGEPVNFNRLPVVDKNWSRDGHKGGFIQEATGWKPSPLQAAMDVDQVLAAAGLQGLPIDRVEAV